MNSIPQKRCTKCQQELPATLEYFHANYNCKYGVMNTCRECRIIERRKTPRPLPVPPGFRRCSMCKEVLPATREYFCAARAVKGGLRPECKKCKAMRCHNQWI